jgi:glycosyltransferase A (GT-A) superfamily protein (DUF2064 family)
MPQPILIVMVKAPRAGEAKTRLVPCWYDIDTGADLTRLLDEMNSSEEALSRAPNPYRWLENHTSELWRLS